MKTKIVYQSTSIVVVLRTEPLISPCTYVKHMHPLYAIVPKPIQTLLFGYCNADNIHQMAGGILYKFYSLSKWIVRDSQQ